MINLLRILGFFQRFVSPGFSWCFRCGRPWNFAKHHTTPYSKGGRGCFPLCEFCWSCLTIDERLPYYLRLYREWRIDAANDDLFEKDWQEIENSVLRGL